MPLARLPKRSEDSVSLASSALGEQHTSSVTLALPPSASWTWQQKVLSPGFRIGKCGSAWRRLCNQGVCLEHAGELGVAVWDVRAAAIR